MNTIYDTSSVNSLYKLYLQSIKATESTDSGDLTAVNNQKDQVTDSLELSQMGMQALNNSMQGVSDINSTASSALDGLVSAGTITQSQANAVASIFQSGPMQSAGVYGSRPTNPLDSLVSSGTISQDQENSIKSAFESAMKSAQTQSSTSAKDPGTTVLDSLVSAGTITQDQENAIQDAFESAMKGI